MGAIGFQLAAYCIGHRRGWADRDELEARVVRILQNLNRLPMGPEPGRSRAGHRGFFYHFLAANIGTRKDESVELSPYDTVLLMTGVQTCKEYFADNIRVQALSQQLFNNVDWDWLVDRSAGANAKQFHLAWKPGPTEAGTFQGHVDGQTDEALLLDILALGSKTHRVNFETYLARNRFTGSYPTTNQPQFLASWQGSLFNYFFADCWIDLRHRGDDQHPSGARNLWRDDQLAVIANRQFCIDHAGKSAGGSNGLYTTYGENSWGLTACIGPTGYKGYGAKPGEAMNDGTIAPSGMAGSIVFDWEKSLSGLKYLYDNHKSFLYGKYGFKDAFNLDQRWWAEEYLGIDQGITVIMLENYRTGLVWSKFMQIEPIRKWVGLCFKAEAAK